MFLRKINVQKLTDQFYRYSFAYTEDSPKEIIFHGEAWIGLAKLLDTVQTNL